MNRNVKKIIFIIMILVVCLYLLNIKSNADTTNNSVLDAQKNMEDYLDKNITSNMSDVQKIGIIGKFIGQYEYGSGSSYTSFFLYGHGDCIASANTAVYMAKYLGFDAHIRYAVSDEGAGNNHHNAAIYANGKLYILEAGYSNYKPPRPYTIKNVYEDNGFSYSTKKGFYQYDGYDEVVNVPKTHSGVKVNTLGDYAFYRGVHSDTKVKTINIGSNITSIGTAALIGPSTLTNINVDASNPNYKSVDGVVYSKDGTKLIAYPTGRKDKKFTIPSTVTYIDQYAFSSNTYLEEVVIPEGVTYIGYSAFMYCENLSKINIPNSVTTISGYAFYNTNFTSITIPENVSKVGSSNDVFIRRNDGGKLEYIKFLGNPMITDNGRIYAKTFYAKANTTAQNYAERYNIQFIELDTNKTIIELSMVKGLNRSVIYGTNNNELNISIIDNGKTLVKDKDYTLTYQNNTEAGKTATLTITGKGNYYGEINYSYKIEKIPFEYTIKSNEIKLSKKKLEIETNLKEDEKYDIFYYSGLDATYGTNVLSLPKDVKDGDVIDIYYSVRPSGNNYSYDSSIKKISVKIVDDRVIDVTSISLNKTSTTLYVGGSETITAVVSPSNATDKTVTWTSSNPSIATVNNGVIKGIKDGNATIFAKASNGRTATIVVTVKARPVEVTGINLSKTSTTLYVGGSETVTAVVSPSNATDKTVTWTSSNPSVATVSNGKITGVNVGSATITAKTSNGKTATIVVTVKAKPVEVTGINLSKTSTTLYVGGSETITAVVLPSNATDKTVTWTSSNPSIATVNNGVIKGIKNGNTTIFARASNGRKATILVTVKARPVEVTGINLSKTSTTLYVGGSETITAVVSPSNATDKTVTWISSNPSVATVSNGKITGVNIGSATITAKTSNGKTATILVTVKARPVEVTGINLSKTSTTLYVGGSETITAVVSPSNATDKTVTWTSSNPSVATVSNGKITGVNVGSATITAKTSNGKTATIVVTVKSRPVEVTGINLSKTSTTLYVGGSETVTAVVSPSNATDKTVTWTSSNPSVATVSNGKITGVNVGSATITAKTSNGKIATIVVTVKSRPVEVTGINLSKTSTTLYVGGSETITAVVSPSNATDKTVTWISSNPSVATVSNGKITGVNVGSATITAKTSNGKIATCKVIVIKKETNTGTDISLKVPNVLYRTHIQNIGWQNYVKDGEMSGTSGKSLRLEGININLENKNYDGNIEYCTHVQNIGWQNYVKNGEMSGTSGRSLRLEAIKIRLTGELANHYDIYYRVHCQNIGWMGWAKNNESAGSAGYSYRLEGIEIVVVEKGKNPPTRTNIQYNKPFKCHTISYRTHVQNVGWQNYVYDGEMSGTSGRSLRLEGININLENKNYDGNIEYCTHVQNIGWQNYVKNGEMSGTSGRGLRLEAIKIRLTGKIAEKYDIYYRVHCQNIGWMGWAKNGESAGSAGYSYRLEGIEIVLIEKGGSAPGSTINHYVEK